MHSAAFEGPFFMRPGWRLAAHEHGGDAGFEHDDHPPRRPGGRGGRRMGPPPFGFGGPGGDGMGPGFRRRGGRSKRGDIRAAVLALLTEQPMHGYQIITELESRSQGAWRPSPGSVYPSLQALEDQGLVRNVERDGRKVFELTPEGIAAAAEATGPKPWDTAAAEVGGAHLELMDLVRQVAMAVTQVATAGTPKQNTAAAKLLTETRRRLYQILAEDDTAPANDSAPANDTADEPQ